MSSLHDSYNLASINIEGRSSPMPPSAHVKKNKSLVLYEKINCLFVMVLITFKVCANLAPQVGDKAILTNHTFYLKQFGNLFLIKFKGLLPLPNLNVKELICEINVG
jgi:hypothetical protein